MPGRKLAAAVFVVLAVAAASGRAAEFRVGQLVFWKFGAAARVGNMRLPIDRISFGETVGAIDGDWVWLHRGWVRQADLQTAEEALETYTRAIEQNPSDSRAYLCRASVLRCRGELDAALDDYSSALRLNPADPIGYANRAAARLSQDNSEEAIRDCNRAIVLDRRCALAYRNRGAAWGNQGRFDYAIRDLDEALRLDPHDVLAYRNRGAAWNQQGQYQRAIDNYTEALRLDPTCLEAWNDSAWLRATCPDPQFRDGSKALTNARRACELSDWKAAHCLGTLAAAHAERGEFDEALAWQDKAISLCRTPEAKQGELERYELYVAHRPLREDLVRRRPSLSGTLQR